MNESRGRKKGVVFNALIAFGINGIFVQVTADSRGRIKVQEVLFTFLAHGGQGAGVAGQQRIVFCEYTGFIHGVGVERSSHEVTS